MEKYRQVFLLLDRDDAGLKYTKKALEWDARKYIDRSDFYRHDKDLNEWLISHSQSRKPSLKAGKHFDVWGASYVLVIPKRLVACIPLGRDLAFVFFIP